MCAGSVSLQLTLLRCVEGNSGPVRTFENTRVDGVEDNLKRGQALGYFGADYIDRVRAVSARVAKQKRQRFIKLAFLIVEIGGDDLELRVVSDGQLWTDTTYWQVC